LEAGSNESAVVKDLDIFQPESLHSFHSSLPPEKLIDDDGDGDSTGALCRVEISRYIARRSAMLAREAEISRRQHSEVFSANICESDDWTTECPGAYAADTMSLKDTAAWTTVLDAISFERAHLRRGSSNQWPDALWSPACLSSEAASSLEVQVTDFITHLDALADGSDAIRCGLHAMPIAVLLRQLLCDLRMATGDLRGAARALAGAVATESGSDPLRPPLLIGWEDSLSCNYLKAQQCYRLGRLALLAVAENSAAAKVAKEEAYTHELRQRREAQHADLARGALLSARPLLRDAARLYKVELESTDLKLLDKEEEWRLALQCCLLLTLQLEAEVCEMLESPADEVKKILSKAIQLSVTVQACPAATARCQRLVFEVHRRLLDKACPKDAT